MSMGDLGSDIFLSFALSCAIEIPAYIAAIWFMDHVGRRPFFVYALFLTGVPCVIAGFMGAGIAKTCVALVGKFGASCCMSIMYLFTAELYPTEIRNTGVGLCVMFSRLGGIAAPQVRHKSTLLIHKTPNLTS